MLFQKIILLFTIVSCALGPNLGNKVSKRGPSSQSEVSCESALLKASQNRIINVEGLSSKEVSLTELFPGERSVLIGLETWGHSFLQVGNIRLDGHVLSEIDVNSNIDKSRKGLLIKFPVVDEKQINALQNAMMARSQKISLSCVFESCRIIEQQTGIKLAEDPTIWLSDFTEIVLRSGFIGKDGFPVPITIYKTMDMPIDSFVERLKSAETKWKSQAIKKFVEQIPSISELDQSTPEERNHILNVVVGHFGEKGLPQNEQALLKIEINKMIAGQRGDRFSDVLERLPSDEDIVALANQHYAENVDFDRSINGAADMENYFSKRMAEMGLPADASVYDGVIRFAMANDLENREANRIIDEALSNIIKRKTSVNMNDLQSVIQKEIDAIIENAVKAKKMIIVDSRFSGKTYPSFVVKDIHQLDRSTLLSQIKKNNSHTLDLQGYIHRHLSKRLMSFLKSNKGIEISLYSAEQSEAVLQDLKGRGFTEIQYLSNNETTDFVKMIASNSEHTKMEFVLWSPKGNGYELEMAAHFQLYRDQNGFPFENRRITLRSSSEDLKTTFTNLLRKETVDPDFIFLAHPTKVEKYMNERGIFSRFVQIGETKGRGMRVFQYGGKQIVAISIEPTLYADRSAKFMEAVNGLSKKRRVLVFSGTAGSLSPDLAINDIIIPVSFTHGSNPDNITSAKKIKNKALTLFKQNKISGHQLTSVESIFVEDRAWLNQHLAAGTTIVEQENAGLMDVINPDTTDYYGLFRITDNLVVGHDFSQTEKWIQQSSMDEFDSKLRRIIQHILSPESMAVP